MDTLRIRAIQPPDNKEIASIIRNTFREFGLDRPGTAYFDTALDNMYDNFQVPGSRYLAGCINGLIAGGGGVYPSPGHDTDTCELVKMYITAAARGMGLGRLLMDNCLAFATEYGYRKVYIETF